MDGERTLALQRFTGFDRDHFAAREAQSSASMGIISRPKAKTISRSQVSAAMRTAVFMMGLSSKAVSSTATFTISRGNI